MLDHPILSEKPEDNQAAVEWGLKQAELRKKSDELTRQMNDKYRPILMAQIKQREQQKTARG